MYPVLHFSDKDRYIQTSVCVCVCVCVLVTPLTPSSCDMLGLSPVVSELANPTTASKSSTQKAS